MGFSNQIPSSCVMRMRPALADNETKNEAAHCGRGGMSSGGDEEF